MSEIKSVQQKKSVHYQVKTSEREGFFVKDVSTSSSIVTGFFNSYNYFDSDYDVLVKGSAAKSITDSGPESNAVAKIKHACDHDLTRIPGKIQVLKESTFTWKGITVPGVYFETKMASTTLGQDTLKNYLDEIIDNHSVGFRYMDLEYVDKESSAWPMLISLLINPEDAENAGYGYIVKEIKLYEGSSVAFGANSLTPYLGAKSSNKEAQLIGLYGRLDKLTKLVRSGKQSDDMLHGFELQTFQIKQMISEIFSAEDMKIKAKMTKELNVSTLDYEKIVSKFSLT